MNPKAATLIRSVVTGLMRRIEAQLPREHKELGELIDAVINGDVETVEKILSNLDAPENVREFMLNSARLIKIVNEGRMNPEEAIVEVLSMLGLDTLITDVLLSKLARR